MFAGDERDGRPISADGMTASRSWFRVPHGSCRGAEILRAHLAIGARHNTVTPYAPRRRLARIKRCEVMTTALIFADIRTRVCHYYGERIVKLQILTNRDVNALLNDGLPLRFNPHLPSDPLRRQLLDD